MPGPRNHAPVAATVYPVTKPQRFLFAASLAATACFNPEAPMDSATEGTGGTATGDSGPTTVDTQSTGPGATTNPDPDSTTSDPTDPSATDTSSESTGPVAEPEIEVSIAGTPVATGDSVAVPVPIAVGNMSNSVTVTVDNVGTGDLELVGVLARGPDATDFLVDQAGLDATIAPGDSSEFSVTFAPQNGGFKGTLLSIGSNDADEDPFEITLTGHTTPNVWREITVPVSPPPRFNAASARMSDGRILMYGGRGPMGDALGDTWIFDPSAETWTQVMPPMSPPPRFAHAMAYAGDGTVVMFGGSTGMGGGAPLPPGTWIFDEGTEQWSMVMTATPPGRFQHSMVSVGASTVIMYGGRVSGGGSEIAETWRFDGVAQAWLNLNPPMGSPPPLSSFAMAYDRAGDRVTLYGGLADFGTLFDQTWNYSVATNSWTLASPPGNPGLRFVLSGAYLLDDRMTVFSGKLDSCCVTPTGGTFSYDPVSDTWADITPPLEPTPRFTYTLTGLPDRNKAILFGGVLDNIGISTAQADTWEYVGQLP